MTDDFDNLEPLSHGWREAHALQGDQALVLAYNAFNTHSARAMFWAAAAQAHYTAANIRARHRGGIDVNEIPPATGGEGAGVEEGEAGG